MKIIAQAMRVMAGAFIHQARKAAPVATLDHSARGLDSVAPSGKKTLSPVESGFVTAKRPANFSHLLCLSFECFTKKNPLREERVKSKQREQIYLASALIRPSVFGLPHPLAKS